MQCSGGSISTLPITCDNETYCANRTEEIKVAGQNKILKVLKYTQLLTNIDLMQKDKQRLHEDYNDNNCFSLCKGR